MTGFFEASEVQRARADLHQACWAYKCRDIGNFKYVSPDDRQTAHLVARIGELSSVFAAELEHVAALDF
jgi:hypothetical protein